MNPNILPPSGVTPEMIQKVAQRLGMRQPGQAPQAGPGNKEQFNPLPEGRGSIQVLKAHSNCPVPQEAATLNALLSKAQETPAGTDKDAELDAAIAEAVTLVLRSDRECERQISTRTAGLFNEEPELKGLTDKLEILYREIKEMESSIKAKADEFNTLSKQRWERSVKTFGLNPQERFYRIENDNRRIVQLDLKCDACQSGKLLRDARQKLVKALMTPGVEASGGKLEE